MGLAGEGPVSPPGMNDDFVYAASDRLYAFPAACSSTDRTCPPTWVAAVPGRPTHDAPAVGGGVVAVASSSSQGGVYAYPAVCTNRCEPLWIGHTRGPSSGVAIEGDTAYVASEGQLLAFPLSCSGGCQPSWVGTFARG